MKQDIKFSKKIEKRFNKTKSDIYTYLMKKIFYLPYGEELLLKKFKKKLYTSLVENNKEFPRNVQLKKYEFLIAMLESTKRSFDKSYISKDAANRIINTLIKYGFVNKDANKKIRKKFEEKYHLEPPSFILLLASTSHPCF